MKYHLLSILKAGIHLVYFPVLLFKKYSLTHTCINVWVCVYLSLCVIYFLLNINI